MVKEKNRSIIGVKNTSIKQILLTDYNKLIAKISKSRIIVFNRSAVWGGGA